MKKFSLIVGLICLSALLAGNAWALTLSFSNLPATYIRFDGGTDSFSFTDNLQGFGFAITGSDSAGQLAIGLDGNIAGSFEIGEVTGTPFPGFPGLYIYSAPVTGTGEKLSISDGTNSLTADLSWNNATTVGTGGILNIAGSLNLTNIFYEGGNAALSSLKSAGEAVVTASFTSPGHSLQQLKDGGIFQTSYSGTLTATPLPGALLLLGAGLVRLAGYAWRKRTVEPDI